MPSAAAPVSGRNPLGYEKIPVLLRRYAIPSIIAMVVSSLYNIVDQIFIGQGVGYLGNAATNVAYPLTTICLSIALLIGIGGASRFSLSLGAGDDKSARRAAGTAVAMLAAGGVLYAVLIELFLTPLMLAFGATGEVLPYAQEYTRITAIGMPFLILTNGVSNLARADGSPRFSMACMLLGAVINTILDPLFIFAFQLGIGGAAWATVIGQMASCAMALSYLPRFRQVRLTRRSFRIPPREALRIASLGMSNSLNQLALTLVQIVLNNSLTYYGALTVYGSDVPLASCGIVMKTNAILIGVIIGLSQGSQPIIGFNYGAKQLPRVWGTYRLAVTCSLVISVAGWLLFQLCPQQIISLFGTGSPEYFEFAVRFMRTYLFMVPVNGVQILSSNFFTAIGKAPRGVFLSLTRQVLFLIPLILILPLFLGLDGILYAAPIADAVAFAVTVVFMLAFYRSTKKLPAVI